MVKDERSRSEGDKQRQGEKVRHDELLAKIQLAWESESFSLCRIDNFFFYSLDEENEERDNVSGRDILSAQSSISSMGSAPSHNRSSSSSFPDEIPVRGDLILPHFYSSICSFQLSFVKSHQ